MVRSAAREHAGVSYRCAHRHTPGASRRHVGACEPVALDPARRMVGWIAARTAGSGQDCCLEPLAAVEDGSRGYTLLDSTRSPRPHIHHATCEGPSLGFAVWGSLSCCMCAEGGVRGAHRTTKVNMCWWIGLAYSHAEAWEPCTPPSSEPRMPNQFGYFGWEHAREAGYQRSPHARVSGCGSYASLHSTRAIWLSSCCLWS
jgi:hypothetical protein